MIYTEEQKAIFNQDLNKLYTYLRDKSREKFLITSAYGYKSHLPPGFKSKGIPRKAIRALLRDTAKADHPFLGRPLGSDEYWIMLSNEPIPTHVVDDTPQHVKDFTPILNRILGSKKYTSTTAQQVLEAAKEALESA